MKNKLLVLLLVLALSPTIQIYSVDAKTTQTTTVIQHKVDTKQCQKYVNSGYQELYSKKNLEIIQNYGFEKLTEEHISDAISDFDKALQNDESCANAYAGRAETFRIVKDINNAKTGLCESFEASHSDEIKRINEALAARKAALENKTE